MSDSVATPESSLKSFAESCANLLVELNERVVFAESCTGGMLSSTLAGVPGISSYHCGSLVTYRPNSKRRWLGVNKSTINQYTTESNEVVEEMALGALKMTPEASWSVAIVGHLGPDAPKDKDGHVWIAIGRRSRKGNLKVKSISEHVLAGTDRILRQRAATETALTLFSRALVNKSSKDNGKRRTA